MERQVRRAGTGFSCPFERKGNWFSVNSFFYFNSNVRGYQKNAHWKKNHKTTKNLVKLHYSAQRVLLRVSKPSTVLCFDLLICPLKVHCKCVAALLTPTPTGARLKYSRYRQNKSFHELLYNGPFSLQLSLKLIGNFLP